MGAIRAKLTRHTGKQVDTIISRTSEPLLNSIFALIKVTSAGPGACPCSRWLRYSQNQVTINDRKEAHAMKHTPNDTIYKLLEQREMLLEACKAFMDDPNVNLCRSVNIDFVRKAISKAERGD